MLVASSMNLEIAFDQQHYFLWGDTTDLQFLKQILPLNIQFVQNKRQ